MIGSTELPYTKQPGLLHAPLHGPEVLAHGLHLLGGLFVWTRTLARSLRKDIEPIDLRLSVELTSVYWHYLLLVWVVLFALLVST